jgi:hypothetical protein
MACAAVRHLSAPVLDPVLPLHPVVAAAAAAACRSGWTVIVRRYGRTDHVDAVRELTTTDQRADDRWWVDGCRAVRS